VVAGILAIVLFNHNIFAGVIIVVYFEKSINDRFLITIESSWISESIYEKNTLIIDYSNDIICSSR